jgi:hypothetical protein
MRFYHYTNEYKAAGIIEDQLLKTSGGGGREKKILWFSTHPIYEPTAIKPIMLGGEMQFHTWAEYQKLFKLYRFQLVSDRYLSPWGTTNKNAKTPSKLRKKMELVGKMQGGKPSQWFGTLDNVPRIELLMQVFDGDVWKSCGPDDYPKKAPDHILQMNYPDALRTKL